MTFKILSKKKGARSIIEIHQFNQYLLHPLIQNTKLVYIIIKKTLVCMIVNVALQI